MEINVVDDEEIQTDVEDDDDDIYIEYDIASYPSDLTLSVIHEMWKEKAITIPAFQRNFVWSIKQSSLLIESFLMGLPVPQVFFYIDEENRGLVIDGQQRILSIIFFFDGYFGPESSTERRQVFRLSGIDKKSPFFRKKFDDLSETHQRRLKNSVLRAVNIRQLTPAHQSTSVYHIFERLNTGGTPLRPQEIRNCVFAGEFADILTNLNKNKSWRSLLGRKNLDKHQRDVEILLRVFSLSTDWQHYEKPMKEFLNIQMKRARNGESDEVTEFLSNFDVVVELLEEKLPPKPFNIRGPLNLAALDSIIATCIQNRRKIPRNLKERYSRLIEDETYKEHIFFNTSDATTVKERMKIAKRYLIS